MLDLQKGRANASIDYISAAATTRTRAG